MEHSIRLADLHALTTAAQESAIASLVSVARAPVNGQAVAVRARIAAFEQRYEMSSEEFVRKLGSHAIEETAEYADWLFWIKLREISVTR